MEQQGLVFDYDDVIFRVNDFFRGRLRTKWQEQGIRYDVADAVLATEDDDYLRLSRKAEAVNALTAEDPEDTLITALNRVESMAKNATSDEVDESALQPEDQEMFASLERAEEINDAMQKDHFPQALQLLRNWMPLINTYMDNTMILVKDEKLQAARLGMLAQVNALIQSILVPHHIVRE